MKTIEIALLHRIITDYEFAQYITQRIDIGDFDDAVANTIYDGIVDILFEEKPVSFSGLLKRYSEEKVVTEALRRIAAHKETV
jgi:hypothetical protein